MGTVEQQPESFSVGDRVSWTQGRFILFGTVVKVMPSGKSVTVKHDSGSREEIFRQRKWGSWPIARETELQAATKRWIAQKPRGNLVSPNMDWHSHDFYGAEVKRLQTTEEIVKAADELMALAQWYARRPKEEKSE